MNKEITLPSGVVLKITLAAFAEGKALYQAVLEEAKSLKLDAGADVDVNFFKDIFCTGFSSKKIEAALNACLSRCLYGNDKCNLSDTWEPLAAREDYISVCFEVAKENLLPFTKNLSAQYAALFQKVRDGLV